MNITEAVNMILRRYPSHGYDVFMDLNKIKDDDLQEAVHFIKRVRKSRRAISSRGRTPDRETFKVMIEKGYTYKDIAKKTGLAESTVGRKTLDYGLRQLYHQMHPDIRGTNVPVICLNVETGEQKTFDTISATEAAFKLGKCHLNDRIKGGKCYIKNGWEFRRGG